MKGSDPFRSIKKVLAGSPSWMTWTKRFFLVFMTLACVFRPVRGLAENTLPFSPGEKLSYEVSWVHIPAGEMRLEVMPMKGIEGVKAYHFMMTSTTTSFVDLFYRLRQTVESFTDSGMSHSILYRKETRGKKDRDETVHFDWDTRVATYEKNGKVEEKVALLSGTFDPLAIFYVLRLQALHVGQTIQVPVSDGKKCVMGKAKVVKREKIRVGNRGYDTFLVLPDLKHIGGVFKKSKEAVLKIWFAADGAKIPVRVESKVKVGSFVAELTTP
jgi:hypothetical protein